VGGAEGSGVNDGADSVTAMKNDLIKSDQQFLNSFTKE